MGDPAGRGSEILAKAFAAPEVRKICRAVVGGDARITAEAYPITRVEG